MDPVLGSTAFDSTSACSPLGSGVHRVEIAPKAVEIITVLVKNAGRIVSEGDLLSAVWPDTIVEEGNLAV
jgi:DNA-binding winged helix-turn-helix (wHTH) protein